MAVRTRLNILQQPVVGRGSNAVERISLARNLQLLKQNGNSACQSNSRVSRQREAGGAGGRDININRAEYDGSCPSAPVRIMSAAECERMVDRSCVHM